MTDSASTDGVGLRERKRTATKLAIITAARILTAERGFSGYTVEELCEKVGISRRTFFNYFPAKEDAVLGSPADEIPADLAEEFIARGASSGRDTISPSLLSDFVDFAAAMMDRMVMSRDQMVQLKLAVAAEPRLLEKVLHGSQEAEEAFATLLSAREGLPPADPRIQAALALFTALAQRAGPAFFDPGNTRPYREILSEAVNAMHEVISAVSPLPHPSSKDPS
ncbi:TetR/AcrR family transcriptional regulator [Arthrobacter sunyaminii]|uniref:TetR/AcrR family transcriptional regulator n=1 Tax=Arthrobacter sunyaminii TaxID=2816859 RepID=A0A975S792_9MICC|nr:TetR/AcrR family transcriptional regulator [Arthrobacter sunyaminii]MBO0908083.1 TetR family transcriptional regulator [Arthrobacter sunyaminii]QWQ37105.1 TetR/AcrR family transcriptional regulator [Arthrobacter sunyaminii]